jgi:integrase
MNKTRRQEGQILKKNGSWYVRFREDEVRADGMVVRKQRMVKLAPVCSEYRTKKSVEPLRDELFARLKLNSPDYNVESTMTLSQFVGGYFFPRYVAQLKPSVRGPHQYNWRKHLEPLCGQVRLRDFRTFDGQQVMDELIERDLSRNTLKRIKSLLSGIFREAIRQGVLYGTNPMREVRIPTVKVRRPQPTYAYSIQEVDKMLNILSEPERTIVAVFAYTGMRKGEVAALRLENIRDGAIWVEQSAWRGQFTDPKSPESKAPIPLIEPLAEILRAHCNGRTEGLLFQSRKGTPLNLDNLARRDMRPTLERVGLQWHGWHAFRRGLATNLKQLDVDDKSIQAILRHADYSTTMNSYVQPVPESVKEGMKRFEQLVGTTCARKSEARPN